MSIRVWETVKWANKLRPPLLSCAEEQALGADKHCRTPWRSKRSFESGDAPDLPTAIVYPQAEADADGGQFSQPLLRSPAQQSQAPNSTTGPLLSSLFQGPAHLWLPCPTSSRPGGVQPPIRLKPAPRGRRLTIPLPNLAGTLSVALP